MTLTEGIVRDQVFIDFNEEPVYGNVQCFICSPRRIPTVGFRLIATTGLVQIADRIRKELGFLPLYPIDEYTEKDCDSEGWYDFSVGLNGWTDSHMDTCIEFLPFNTVSDDNEELYTIDLTAGEQAVLYSLLDEQCRKYLGRSCEDLLAESQREMEEDS